MRISDWSSDVCSSDLFGFGGDSYEVTARFTNLGPLRANAPVKVGGVAIGHVSDIALDPVKLDSVVTLAIDKRYSDLPADTSAAILTSGLLGESHVGLQPGGDPEIGSAWGRDRVWQSV